MIDYADIAILGAMAIIFIASILASRITLHRDSWTVQKYKLYRVRDNLIYLVATNKIQESDLVFQQFYKAVNCFIDANDRINHGSFIAAAEKARSKGLDPAEERNFREIRTALRKMGPEVNEAANAFYVTILGILIENSLLLRLIVKLGSMSAALKFLASSVGPRSASKSAFRFYDDYSRAIIT